MLSEDSIENLIEPIINRQEAINEYVIRQIAKRIKEIGKLRPSDVYKLEQLLKTGSDVKLINAEIARLTNLNVNDIKAIIKVVAADLYKDAKPFYDYRHKSYIPFAKNEPLQKIVKAIENITVGDYKNLSNSKATGFLVEDRKHPGRLIFKSVGDTYRSMVDEAVQAVRGGIQDYSSAMRNSLKQLVESGLRRLSWDSGYTQRLDTALRRNILDGVRAVNQGVQDEVGKQFGADGKEITVHANSAPDHEPIQGHQFTNEEFEKLQSEQPFYDVKVKGFGPFKKVVPGTRFAPIKRPIGKWNCRHFTYSIIIGVTKPNFTEKQLQEYMARNKKGYTLANGKHLTMYECTQKQRQMETAIRKLRDGQIAAKEAGDLELAKQYQAKVSQKMKEYVKFSNNCGLSSKLQKASVPGYKKIAT